MVDGDKTVQSVTDSTNPCLLILILLIGYASCEAVTQAVYMSWQSANLEHSF